MHEGYNTSGDMSDDQLARERDAQAGVKDAEAIIREQVSRLYALAGKSDVCAGPISEFAEELETALSDFCPNQAQWSEAISTRRNTGT